MPTMLRQHFLEALGAHEGEADLPAASEIFLLRSMRMLYDLTLRAPQSALMEAAASGSNAALLRSISELVLTESPASEAWEAVMLRGRVALAEAVEATGGVWSTEVALERLQVSRQTLLNWRRERRVLALPRAGNTFVYPVAQFAAPGSDADVPRPYEVIQQIALRVGAHLTPEELVGLLATPQDMLARDDGHPMTPFAAIAAGAGDDVLRLVDWFVTPADDGAPDAPGDAPALHAPAHAAE